jgi:hypothetical protein
MAGGPHAHLVPCATCMWEHQTITKAERVSEGIETDHYVCEQGHAFGIDYARGPATEPQWPPSPELVEAIKVTD